MTKDQILSEIRRTAKANRGVPLGRKRFEDETGIGEYDWQGQFGFGIKWNDLLREAGFDGNRFGRDKVPDGELVQALIALTRRLKRVPVKADLRFAKRQDENFPHQNSLRRLGTKPQIASRIVEFCRSKEGYDDVLALWEQAMGAAKPDAAAEEGADSSTATVGYVYLLRHGARSEYKIGRTCSPLRREGEVGIELPEKLAPIHYIETDDPAGVENYWHTRFAGKRKQGEWFALSSEDVRAFKRWKRIY